MPGSIEYSRRRAFVAAASVLMVPRRAAGAEVACSPSQLTVAQAALRQAKDAMNTSINRLANPNAEVSAGLREWFGDSGAGAASTVRDVLTRAVVFTDGVTFRCLNVSRPVYAYVQSGSPFGIVLGSLFFPAPETGFDSRPGVIVHEMTHFLLVGGTGDDEERYGVVAARARAATDPALALRTADNFEYFVEALALP